MEAIEEFNDEGATGFWNFPKKRWHTKRQGSNGGRWFNEVLLD